MSAIAIALALYIHRPYIMTEKERKNRFLCYFAKPESLEPWGPHRVCSDAVCLGEMEHLIMEVLYRGWGGQEGGGGG